MYFKHPTFFMLLVFFGRIKKKINLDYDSVEIIYI